MKIVIYFFFMIFLGSRIIAQDSVIIYMDKDFEAVNDKNDAVIIRSAVIKNNRYYILDQYVDGRKIMMGEYISVDPWTEDGAFVFYDYKGNKYADGQFVNGAMDGQWVYYDSTGMDTVIYKKEWMDIIKTGALYKYSGNPKILNEDFYKYVSDKLHFPPKLLLDCISRNEKFHLSISKDRDINIKPFYSKLESDFSNEFYRVLVDIPDSLIFKDNKKKLYYTVAINYTCPGDQTGLISNPCNSPVFVFVKNQATFQGGNFENFREWVQMNLIYPEQSVINGERGRVVFQFVVTSTGRVDCIKVLRSSGYPLLDNEAMRVLSSSPIWSPAKQDGKAVNQQFVMPVIFQIMDVKF